MNRELIYDTLFNLLNSYLTTVPIYNESIPIPDDPYQYIVDWSQRFISDIGVTNAVTSVAFTKILSGTPITGQYKVNSQGVYTFAAADVGTNVLISYNFTGLVTSSRRLLHWNDVAPADQPAMFLVKKSERNDKIRGIQDKWTFFYELYIYVNTTNDPTVIPSSLMNPILDQVDNMFSPNDLQDFAVTLGGLVSHVAINGEIITDEGVLGDQAISIVPIEVLVPS
jgi:hypothetical protein